MSSPLTPVHDCRLHLRPSDVSGHASAADDLAAGAMQHLAARLPALRPVNAPSKVRLLVWLAPWCRLACIHKATQQVRTVD